MVELTGVGGVISAAWPGAGADVAAWVRVTSGVPKEQSDEPHIAS